MFIIEELVGILSSENSWLFPRSQPDPLSCLFLAHTFSCAPSLCLCVLCDLYLPSPSLLLPGQFLWSTFLSLTPWPSSEFTPLLLCSCLSLCLSFTTLWPICFSSERRSTEWRKLSGCGHDGVKWGWVRHPLDYYYWLTHVKWCVCT